MCFPTKVITKQTHTTCTHKNSGCLHHHLRHRYIAHGANRVFEKDESRGTDVANVLTQPRYVKHGCRNDNVDKKPEPAHLKRMEPARQTQDTHIHKHTETRVRSLQLLHTCRLLSPHLNINRSPTPCERNSKIHLFSELWRRRRGGQYRYSQHAGAQTIRRYGHLSGS